MSVAAPEIKSLTGVRGAAALLVAIYHFHIQQMPTGWLSGMLRHGYLSVDLFFILSGFVMAHVYGHSFRSGEFSFSEFLLHRFARIYPLYITVTIGMLALAIMRPHGSTPEPAVVVSNAMMLQAVGDWPSIDPPAWSVSAEILAYLLFPAIAGLSLKSSRPVAIAVGLVALGSIFGLALAAKAKAIDSPLSNGDLDLFFSPYSVIRCFAGFTIGQLIWRLHNSGRMSRLLSGNAMQAGVIVALILALNQRLADYLAYIPIMALIFALSADRGMLSRIFGSSPIYILGKLSFGIYLLHFAALGLMGRVERLLLQAGSSPNLADICATVIVCALVIGAAWLLYLCVERPSRLLIRKIADRYAASALPELTRSSPATVSTTKLLEQLARDRSPPCPPAILASSVTGQSARRSMLRRSRR